jgi:hypothetical protein
MLVLLQRTALGYVVAIWVFLVMVFDAATCVGPAG